MARILIVDDEPAHLHIASLICERLGHVVTTASGGEAALALLAATGFDLLIIDVMMPGLDGLALLSLVRQDAAHAAMPVLGLTAALSPFDRSAMRAAGMAAWVGKPYDRQTLQTAVEQALEATTQGHRV